MVLKQEGRGGSQCLHLPPFSTLTTTHTSNVLPLPPSHIQETKNGCPISLLTLKENGKGMNALEIKALPDLGNQKDKGKEAGGGGGGGGGQVALPAASSSSSSPLMPVYGLLGHGEEIDRTS